MRFIVTCILVLVIAGTAGAQVVTVTPPVQTLIDSGQVEIVYAAAIRDGSLNDELAKLSFPVASIKGIPLCVDGLISISNGNAGIGGSARLMGSKSRLTVGVGYMPQGLGLCWYAGLKVLEF
jgi:hypothetical protein